MKNLEELMTQGRIRRESRRDEFVRKSLLSDEFLDLIQKNKKPFDLMMSYYQCAIMEIETKFRVLDQEYSLEYDKNPIEAIKSRVKSPESLAKKIRRKNIPMSLTSIEENIKDIAGVRVICSFPDDIYELEESFLKQDDIVLIERKDYIKNPKPNGYRSYHMIVEIPVFFSKGKTPMRAEIQIRTNGMDFWATLEHQLRYKQDIEEMDGYEEVSSELLNCARAVIDMDNEMQRIKDKIGRFHDI